MLIRGIAGCLVGCIVSVALTFGFNLNGDVSFLVGIVCGTVCTGIALNIMQCGSHYGIGIIAALHNTGNVGCNKSRSGNYSRGARQRGIVPRGERKKTMYYIKEALILSAKGFIELVHLLYVLWIKRYWGTFK